MARVFTYACVDLREGDEVYYVPPGLYEKGHAIEKIQGARAQVIGFEKEFVDPTGSKQGGIYEDLAQVKIQFAGGYELDTHPRHLLVPGPRLMPVFQETARLSKKDTWQVCVSKGRQYGKRIGDIPYPVLYYPEDMVTVSIPGVDQDARKVHHVDFEDDGRVVYQLGVTDNEIEKVENPSAVAQHYLYENIDKKRIVVYLSRWMNSSDITLVTRGNVWKLCHGEVLEFTSDSDALRFFGHSAVSEMKKDLCSIEEVITFLENDGDVVFVPNPESFTKMFWLKGCMLHERFSTYRDQARSHSIGFLRSLIQKRERVKV